MIFKLIYYIIIFYLIYKLGKYVVRLWLQGTKKNSEVQDQSPKTKLNIKKEDIVEAEFEDITEEKEKEGEKKD